MLLSAFYKNMNAVLTNKAMTAVNTDGSSVTNYNTTYDGYRFRFDKLGTVSDSKTSWGVVFGTSDIPPSFNDYFLKGTMLTCFSGSGALTVEEDDTGVTYTSVLTITNTGSTDVTIKEVGYLACYSYTFMFDRTVLDEPLTIPAGGIGQVEYKIRLNYPT